mmetsp:Transcript_40889/g.80674  ORF Transcript_40889/g.80674 Transcript_40889/m.80674 type:complete len:160 (-) Transcript_40889:34-513(-)
MMSYRLWSSNAGGIRCGLRSKQWGVAPLPPGMEVVAGLALNRALRWGRPLQHLLPPRRYSRSDNCESHASAGSAMKGISRNPLQLVQETWLMTLHFPRAAVTAIQRVSRPRSCRKRAVVLFSFAAFEENRLLVPHSGALIVRGRAGLRRCIIDNSDCLL